jgi:hypothetical protein
MKMASLTHEFVDSTPTELDEGILYVSMRFRTCVHLCACGCGNKVVTPLRPAKWKLIFDGDSVSLSPSIGNWQFPCRSHYWLDQSKIRWAKPWTDEEINAGRQSDAQDLHEYYASRQIAEPSIEEPSSDRKMGTFSRLWRRVTRRSV